MVPATMSKYLALTLASLLAGHAQGAVAQDAALTLDAEYITDLVAVTQGDDSGVARVDYMSLGAGLDLDRAIGWRGAHLFVQGIAATGGTPNDLAGTVQGINNIEVPEKRARLFQFWVEQALPGGGNLRVGFSDLNEEFYATDAAGLLIAPVFGIGSELAATGPGGPSIFPSTAAMARLRIEREDGAYVQMALVNAEAGVPGDRGGIRPLLRQGALAIAETGLPGPVRLTLGAWTYTRRQDDTRDLGPDGAPLRRHARGLYALAEGGLVRNVTGFVRAGVSDGDTAAFSGGWQAGFLASPALASRPDSLLSFGVHQGFLATKFRANEADQGRRTGRAESALELTYADKPAPWLTIQPDIQYIRLACRPAGCADAVIGTLRITIATSLR